MSLVIPSERRKVSRAVRTHDFVPDLDNLVGDKTPEGTWFDVTKFFTVGVEISR